MRVILHGVVHNLSGDATREAFVVSAASAPPELLVRYFVDYLDAGTEAECASHPALHEPGNIAAALLTMRYLRPRRERFTVERIEVSPPRGVEGEMLHRDAHCVITAVTEVHEG